MADLKAGDMGDPAWDGLPADPEKMPPEFRNSMAAAIEAALNHVLANEGRDPLNVHDNSPETRERRLLFCAIAQGVVTYLHENADAFRVHLQFVDTQVVGATIEIRTQ
jgi:hypothetical protein